LGTQIAPVVQEGEWRRFVRKAMNQLEQDVEQPTGPVIVVGVDCSELGDVALDRAVDMARAAGGSVHAVFATNPVPPLPAGGLPHGPPLPPAPGELMSALGRHLEERLSRASAVGVSVVAHVGVGSPASVIAELSRQVAADVIVVATRGRRGLSRLLFGSVAEALVHKARCPVLVVRPPALEPVAHPA
jgi:nucleotide-binding universal stress UspA family protein